MFTSILRTIIPALWAGLINWVLVVVPLLEPHREELLAYGLPLAVVASAILTALWYAFWRWLEPKLPAWLTRAVLGSAKAPTYDSDLQSAIEAAAAALEAEAAAYEKQFGSTNVTAGVFVRAAELVRASTSNDEADDEPQHRQG